MSKDRKKAARSQPDNGSISDESDAQDSLAAEPVDDVLAQAQPDGGQNGDDAAAEEPVPKAEGESGVAAEVAELQDQLLRKQADFENFRRRLHRDKDEAIRYANTEVLLDLADVIDGLERAVRTGGEADAASLRDGVSLIEKQLTGLLERKWGFCRFSSEGEPFNPERHQAIASDKSAEHEVATVVEDYQSGYLLHGRVVRPARVKVAQPVSGTDDERSIEGGEPANAVNNADVVDNVDTKEGT